MPPGTLRSRFASQSRVLQTRFAVFSAILFVVLHADPASRAGARLYRTQLRQLPSASSFFSSGTQDPQLPPAFKQAVMSDAVFRPRKRIASPIVLRPTPKHEQIVGRTSERFGTTRDERGGLVSINSPDPGLLIGRKK